MGIETLKIEQLKTDGGTQTRDAINEWVVTEYAKAMESGAPFPPVVVYHDGSTYWLADGFHRWLARNRRQEPTIEADVRPGGRVDALLYALAANAEHGLPRTPADKRKCVRLALSTPEWQG